MKYAICVFVLFADILGRHHDSDVSGKGAR